MKRQVLLLFWITLISINYAFSQAGIDFNAIDKHARKSPKEIEQDIKLLADYLAEKSSNELEKVRSIYVWVTNKLTYDYQAYKNGNKRINRNNQDILERKKAVCFGYSTLFKALCEEMGIKAELISGYSWDTLTSTENPDEPDHAWNAVRIDSTWYLLDATWGSSTIDKKSTYLKSDNQDYFLVDPKLFISSHLPQDPMWQLLDCPIDLTTFFSKRGGIAALLNSEDACFNYIDSISAFTALSPSDQKIKTAENAMQFNPSQDMKDELASIYIDQAGILSDQVEKLDPQTEAQEIKELQNQMITWFRKATPLSDLYDWQWELFISTLVNQAVINYNSSTPKNRKEMLEYSIELLSEAEKLLVHSTNTFFKSQAEQQCAAYLKVMQGELDDMKK